jgi:hypothetical protein
MLRKILAATATAALLLSFIACTPSPTPVPTPPEPPPVPVPIPIPPNPGRPLAIVATYDPLNEQQASAAFWVAAETRQLLASRGHALRYIEQPAAAAAEAAPAELRPYVITAAAFQPAALAIGNGGEILFAGPSPATAAELLPIVAAAENAALPKNMFFDGRFWRPCGAKKPKPGLPPGTHAYGSQPDEPIIEPEAYQEVNLEHLCPPALDQDGYNSCTAAATLGAQRMAITRTGMPDDQLSIVDLYSRINGGRDNGAGIDDAATEIASHGTCTTNTAQMWGINNPNHKPGWQADRANHRAPRVAWLTNRQQLDSALQRGHPVIFGTDVNASFKPDAEGYVPKRLSQNGGGHAMFLYGMVKKKGE